jgi:hypothetical protein
MNRFQQLAASLGDAYDAFKAAEKKFAGTKGAKAQPGLKQEFLDEATQAAAQEILATKVTSFADTTEEKALEQAKKRNPRWDVERTSYDKKRRVWLVMMKENPKYKNFTYVDKKNKRVWQKQVVDGSPWLDEVELKAKDNDLWERVSKMERVFKGIDELTPQELAEIEDYIYPGAPIVKLAAPRKAKKEELE